MNACLRRLRSSPSHTLALALLVTLAGPTLLSLTACEGSFAPTVLGSDTYETTLADGAASASATFVGTIDAEGTAGLRNVSYSIAVDLPEGSTPFELTVTGSPAGTLSTTEVQTITVSNTTYDRYSIMIGNEVDRCNAGSACVLSFTATITRADTAGALDARFTASAIFSGESIADTNVDLSFQ